MRERRRWESRRLMGRGGWMTEARFFQLSIDAPLMVGRPDKLGRMVGDHLSVLVSQYHTASSCFIDHISGSSEPVTMSL